MSGIAGLTGFSLSTQYGRAAFEKQNKYLETDVVKAFVAAGHNDLSKVKEMLAEEPNLIYASYDWGNGDFEEAIEGAGHVGDKEIANYLIEQGARPNLFVLTMLGQSHLVLPILETYPALIHAKGPHGFTLLHHAKVGGEVAKDIRDYLLEKGLEETKYKI
jgi:hypothetical protein